MDRWMDRWEREGFFYFILFMDGWMEAGRQGGRGIHLIVTLGGLGG